MSIRKLRVSQLWNERPWKRKKQEEELERKAETLTNESQPQQELDKSFTATIERNAKRLSRIWKNNEDEDAPPTRSQSLRQAVKHRRSFFRSNDEPTLQEDSTVENDAPVLQAPMEDRETILKRLRRKSQNLSLPRPRTSSGIPKRRSFFSSSTEAGEEETVPAMPAFVDRQSNNRARHVPIRIDHLQHDEEPHNELTEFGPGMAITTNEVRSQDHAFAEKPRARPMSSSSSFSQLRSRTARPVYQNAQARNSESSDDDDDVLTALPSVDFKEFQVGELRSPETYKIQLPPVARHVMQRVTPKVVDIVAPRPLSMFSSPPPARKEPPRRERHKSMLQPVTSSPIGPLEDGPKGDWSRTRHSWIGAGEDDSEQIEWQKLKQFMEAYGNGQDGGIITVRPVDTDSSDSSGSARNSHGAKFSNAQALAALEFGLT